MKSTLEVTLIRTNRKTVSIQIKRDLSIVVRAPKHVSTQQIEKVVREKEPWIRKHMAMLSENAPDPLSEDEIRDLYKKASDCIPEKVRYYADIIGVTFGKVTIRHQKTRWGSCSSKGNLNFNCLIMLAPPEVIDYVVVHELCHRKELNHSKQFWKEVEKVIPDYKEHIKWLKKEGAVLIAR